MNKMLKGLIAVAMLIVVANEATFANNLDVALRKLETVAAGKLEIFNVRMDNLAKANIQKIYSSENEMRNCSSAAKLKTATERFKQNIRSIINEVKAGEIDGLTDAFAAAKLDSLNNPHSEAGKNNANSRYHLLNLTLLKELEAAKPAETLAISLSKLTAKLSQK